MDRFLSRLVAGAGALLVGACAAGNPDAGTGGSGASVAGPTVQGSTGAFESQASTGGSGPACATFTAEGKQEPAAMLIVLDKTASMTTSSKWSTAQQAVVQAVDQDSFDSLSLGLVAFPQTFQSPPQCLCTFYGLDPASCAALLDPGVSCGVSGLPQVAIAPAGMEKSNASTGVRHDIYQYLVNNTPLSNADDGSPIYEAMVSGYQALEGVPDVSKRMLVLVTDGGFSCTSVASPARPGYTDGACPDWEYPDTVNSLITTWRDNATTPINTFIVGLPGSNSHAGEMQGAFAVAPYSMLLALSTYAVSGSPDTVDPTCDLGLAFSQSGTDPQKPCHIDLSSGAFDATTLAAAIDAIRGKALGCVYDLPTPPDGETIDLAKVNVQVTQGTTTTTLPKRTDPTDVCETELGCWDYDDDGKIELIGKSCADVTASVSTKVEIYVGCTTIVK